MKINSKDQIINYFLNGAKKNILIGVDGGVNIKTIKSVYETGVDITIVGSWLYKADNIKERYENLLNV